MHSSRMYTARLLPVSPSMHCSQGVYLVLGGVPGPGGYLVQGVYLVQGGVPGLGCAPAQGGVPGPGGVPAQGVPAQVLPPPL